MTEFRDSLRDANPLNDLKLRQLIERSSNLIDEGNYVGLSNNWPRVQGIVGGRQVSFGVNIFTDPNSPFTRPQYRPFCDVKLRNPVKRRFWSAKNNVIINGVMEIRGDRLVRYYGSDLSLTSIFTRLEVLLPAIRNEIKDLITQAELIDKGIFPDGFDNSSLSRNISTPWGTLMLILLGGAILGGCYLWYLK